MGPFEDGVWLLDASGKPGAGSGRAGDAGPVAPAMPSRLAKVLAGLAIAAGLAVYMGATILGPRIAGAVTLALTEEAPRIAIARDSFVGKDGTRHSVVSFKGKIPIVGIEGIIAGLARSNLRPGDVILLSSPGGSVINSLKLGRTIRRLGLNTMVAEQERGKGLQGAECASACVFLFAAGINRVMPAGSKLGVHRFFNSSGLGDVDGAQITSAAIVSYVSEMGVSPDFLARMVLTRGIRWLSPAECALLKLVTA